MDSVSTQRNLFSRGVIPDYAATYCSFCASFQEATCISFVDVPFHPVYGILLSVDWVLTLWFCRVSRPCFGCLLMWEGRLGADAAWISYGTQFYGSSGMWETVTSSLASFLTLGDASTTSLPFLGSGFWIGVHLYLVYFTDEQMILLIVSLGDSYIFSCSFVYMFWYSVVFGWVPLALIFLYLYIYMFAQKKGPKLCF